MDDHGNARYPPVDYLRMALESHGGATPPFDRDLTTYRIGGRELVPANAGFGSVPRHMIRAFGAQSSISRWKVIVAATVPAGQALPANGFAGLRFFVRSDFGGEFIPRRCFVRAGVAVSNNEFTPLAVVGGQTLYVPGRSLLIEAVNPNAFPVFAQYGTDEATAGFSFWTDFEEITTAVEVALDMPSFTHTFTVNSSDTGPSPMIRGYSAAGTLIYQQILTTGQSIDIRNNNGLLYTIQPAIGPAATFHVLYNCIG